MKVTTLYFFTVFLFLNLLATDFYQIYYTEEPLTKKEISYLEYIYGCNLVVLPLQGKPPKSPRRVDGILLHSDINTDPLWVMGTINPFLDIKDLTKELTDRWTEAQFLTKYAPSLAPETELAAEMLPSSSTEDVGKKLEELRQEILKKFNGIDAILKLRGTYGSDGKLPTTRKRWDVIYEEYIKHTKPKIAELRARYPEAESVVKEHANKLPAIEGEALEQLILHPENVIVQKMVPIDLEVRVHIINGQLLQGGTTIRWCRDGKYLSENQSKLLEAQIQNEFLAHLNEKYKNLSATMDVAISGNNFSIIDLNAGMESGMYYPENDLFISNKLTEFFTGRSTPYLDLLKEFDNASMQEKPIVVKEMLVKFGPFLQEHETWGFWDQLILGYIREIAKNPTEERYFEALEQLSSFALDPKMDSEGALKVEAYQFLEMHHRIADMFPDLKLTAKHREFWMKYLRSIGREPLYVKDGHIRTVTYHTYDNEDALKAAIELALTSISTQGKTPEEIASQLKNGPLKNFYTRERLRREAPKNRWAERKSELKGNEFDVYVSNMSDERLIKIITEKLQTEVKSVVKAKERPSYYRRLIKTTNGIEVWEVDGAYVRQNLNDQFTNFAEPLNPTFKDTIPKNEFWLDIEATPGEEEYFIKHLEVEYELMKNGMLYKDASDAAMAEEQKSRNSEAKVIFARLLLGLGRVDDVLKMIRQKELPELSGNKFKTYLVDGSLVRSIFYIDFTGGGHDQVYKFIPEGEIWLDNDVVNAEQKFVILHEINERALMLKGVPYDTGRITDAHPDSSRVETICRKNINLLSDYLKRAIEANDNFAASYVKDTDNSRIKSCRRFFIGR